MAVEDIKWLATVGNPQLAQAGVRKLDIRWFTHAEQAKAWLAEA